MVFHGEIQPEISRALRFLFNKRQGSSHIRNMQKITYIALNGLQIPKKDIDFAKEKIITARKGDQRLVDVR